MPRNTLATVELQYPFAHIVEEVAVVRYGNHRTLILLQVLLQPVDTFGIKVVGRLIKQQHVGLLQQQSAESYTTTLTTREVSHGKVALRTAQCSHGTVELRVHVPCISGINNILHLRETCHQLVHLVGVRVILLQCKLSVYVLILGKCIIHLLHSLHNILLYGLRFVERWVLRQIAHSVAWAPYHFALCRLFQSGDDFHQR